MKSRLGENGGGGLFIPSFLSFYSISSTQCYLRVIALAHGVPSLHYVYNTLYFLATLIHIFNVPLSLLCVAVPAQSASALAWSDRCPDNRYLAVSHTDQAGYISGTSPLATVIRPSGAVATSMAKHKTRAQKHMTVSTWGIWHDRSIDWGNSTRNLRRRSKLQRCKMLLFGRSPSLVRSKQTMSVCTWNWYMGPTKRS